MRCPKCEHVVLIEQPVDDPEAMVLNCRSCGGFWFGPGALTSVLAVAAKGLKVLDEAQGTDLVCPDCHKPLYHFSYPQTMVKVDMCRRCQGIWLDAGELKEIKTVRQHLAEIGTLDMYAPVPGLKGALLRFIDTTIGAAINIDKN